MPRDHDLTPANHPGADGLIDDVDATLLRRLATAWHHLDPVPASLVDGVTFAVALDEVYAEVAQIQRQGAGQEAVGVRGRATSTEAPGMSFSTSELTMTIMVTPRGRDRLRIDGWVTPAGTGLVRLRLPDETRRHPADQGRFWFDDVPPGLVQLLVEADDGNVRMITPAVTL